MVVPMSADPRPNGHSFTEGHLELARELVTLAVHQETDELVKQCEKITAKYPVTMATHLLFLLSCSVAATYASPEAWQSFVAESLGGGA